LNEETQSPAQIYASESESQPLPAGTVVADESGYAYFYARGGRYRIQSNDLNIDWRHVALGSAATADVVQLTGGSTTNVMSQKAVSDQLLGVGQTWQDVTSSRSPDTVYTNTTGRAIVVSVTTNSTGGWSRVGLTISGINHTSSTGEPNSPNSNEFSTISG